jgi:hypothetical protein
MGPLHPCQLAKARLLVIPAPPTRSAPTLPERKSRRCDLLHKGLRRLGLNHHNGSENPSITVRLTIGHRHRLCLGRHRRSSHTAGAGLPDPDLTSFPPFAPRFRTLSMFAPDKVHAFCEVCSRRDVRDHRRIASSANATTFRISQPGLCESCIRLFAASACRKTGA